MIVLTLDEVRNLVQKVLAGRRPLADLREYVFLAHEGEEVEVDVALKRSARTLPRSCEAGQ
jgi:hypothetical protein